MTLEYTRENLKDYLECFRVYAGDLADMSLLCFIMGVYYTEE